MGAATLKILPAAVLAALCSSACPGSRPRGETPLPDGGDAGDNRVEHRRQPRLVYSWVDEAGRVQMSSRLEQVPPSYRGRVTVTDLGRPRRQRLADDRAVVLDLRREGLERNYSLVDLRRLVADGGTGSRLAESERLARSLSTRLQAVVLGWLGIDLLEGSDVPAEVVLYSAPWCGFCKRAAAFLRRRHVPFRELDIEADERAAAELQAKLARAGLRSAGIPVLDIAGQLVVGFDEQRLTRLLERLGLGE